MGQPTKSHLTQLKPKRRKKQKKKNKKMISPKTLSLILLACLVCQVSAATLWNPLGGSGGGERAPAKLAPDTRVSVLSGARSLSPSTSVVRPQPPKSQRRDLGLLALKVILLGPLIGLTIKAALVRGLIWALLAYGLHLFFPALLSSLGLGSGLVGFARQLRPDYGQMAAAYFVNLVRTLPGQYNHVIAPIVDSIRAIPEGHCRYRAVCETASHLIRNARTMSTSLQRISATVFMNFGTDYSKAWLDGIVQSDCAAKYSQCAESPFSMVAARLAQTIK